MAIKSIRQVIPKYRIHWHVLLIHFPISFFMAAFGFQILHLFTETDCFELATNVALIAGTITLIPTIWSGWRSWKNNYKAAKVITFQRKITTAFVMLGVSIPLTVWRAVFLGVFEQTHTSVDHIIYLLGNTLLIIGAVIEGYYGGRLNHR